MAPERLDYVAIVATRNRPEALTLSLPLLLGQTRPPAEIIVVDSSNDHAAVARVVEAATAGAKVAVQLIHTDPSSSRQRNIGIAKSTAPILLFPDDDSLLFPDTAERIMAVYERDIDARLAAVGGAQADRPPPGVDLDIAPGDADTGALTAAITAVRLWIDRALTWTSPFEHIGRRLNAQRTAPNWLQEAHCVPVSYVTGFRMSFRRSALEGFDETLSRYAWFEDVDAHFSAMRHGLVVACLEAPIYHHRFPGARGDGRSVGRWALLNRAYVAMKAARANSAVFSPGGEAWRVRLHGLVRVLAYLPGARSALGRARLRGAAEGWWRMGPLLRAGPDGLAAAYRAASRDR
ncbi:MAG: glycosyltransferase [Pseudomonadota bacterium]